MLKCPREKSFVLLRAPGAPGVRPRQRLQKQPVPEASAFAAAAESLSRGVRVGPATVSAKRMAIITAVSVVDTLPLEANTSITISKNKNHSSLNTAFPPPYKV